ncbi:MAG TPA: NAD(+)/NADH kinase [Pseudomonadales bacterium]|nr:NAD(+)/NADH kinase [Pseudomonadales bacterium]
MNERAPARRGRVGIIANPMAGRDVRRLAARATEVTHQAKRDMVARIAAGADAAGIEVLFVHAEPFRISTGAVEHMTLGARVEVVDSDQRIENGAMDTFAAVQAMRRAGVGALVVLGGDGTNRIVTHAWPDAPLVPVSTGTNNVFPRMVEPTLAGLAAGLIAAGRVPLSQFSRRAKVIRVRQPGHDDTLALVDAVLLRDDFVGNRLPVDPARIDRMLLTVASPASVGMSPIGGLVAPVSASDDGGLFVTCNTGPTDRRILAPVSPGLFREVRVHQAHRVASAVTVLFDGPGVIALDGDREIKVVAGERARLHVERSGPRVIDVDAVMQQAAAEALLG